MSLLNPTKTFHHKLVHTMVNCNDKLSACSNKSNAGCDKFYAQRFINSKDFHSDKENILFKKYVLAIKFLFYFILISIFILLTRRKATEALYIG